jgi:chaperonin GroES
VPALAKTVRPPRRRALPQASASKTSESLEYEKVEVDIVSVNIKPLEDRIVVKPLDAEQTTASGLVIPDTAKEKPQEGEVIAVGPGRFNEDGDERIPMDISVGDKVIYSKYGGTEVKYSGEEFLILSGRDVLAIVG